MFEVAINGNVERGSDDAKLQEIVEQSLSAGPLSVASAQIPFTVRDGRLRVSPTPLDGESALAIVSGSYDITSDQVDMRAGLASTSTGSANDRPQVQIFAVGPSYAINRAIDVAALSSWLAVRSIDREISQNSTRSSKAWSRLRAFPRRRHPFRLNRQIFPLVYWLRTQHPSLIHQYQSGILGGSRQDFGWLSRYRLGVRRLPPGHPVCRHRRRLRVCRWRHSSWRQGRCASAEAARLRRRNEAGASTREEVSPTKSGCSF